MKVTFFIMVAFSLMGCAKLSSTRGSSAVGAARSPIVAATTFVAIASTSALLESELSQNHSFEAITGDALMKEIRVFESEKRKLIAYPMPGWSEESEDLLRRFSKGSPVTGFLDFQNPVLDEKTIISTYSNHGMTIIRSSLRLHGGGASSCEVLLTESPKGWVVEDFYSEGSSARKRLAGEIHRIRTVN